MLVMDNGDENDESKHVYEKNEDDERASDAKAIGEVVHHDHEYESDSVRWDSVELSIGVLSSGQRDLPRGGETR